jgi:hypothetical protein
VKELQVGFKHFPEPLSKPYNLENSTELPSDIDCEKIPWYEYYVSVDVCKSFQQLYDNINGVQIQFQNY